MQRIKKIEISMSVILTIGMLLSSCLVILGGTSFLIQHGSENILTQFIQSDLYHTNINMILNDVSGFSSIGIIELGILVLVATQIIRVAMLVCFYGITRDYWFSCISLFILIVLVYSFFWRH